MDRPFKSVLDYIKSIFSFTPLDTNNRKRCSNFDLPASKNRRFSPYSTKSPSRVIPIEKEVDDIQIWYPRKGDFLKNPTPQARRRIPMKPLKPETIVIEDDGSDARKFNSRIKFDDQRKIKSFTSTPSEKDRFLYRNEFQNGNDIILVNTIKSPKEKQLDAKLRGFDYLKPKLTPDKPLFHIGSNGHSSMKSKEKSKYVRSSLNGSRVHSADLSVRLDDKYLYKKLLEQVSSNDSSIYQTPVGKVFNSYDFSNLNTKKTSPIFGLEKSKEQETTKERIIKILDGLENNALVIKDSDSEDSVVMVTPPSPKPDIKVDPINSFKKIVDTSQAANKDWLSKLVEDHKQYVEERQRQIDDIRQCSQKTEEINKDINIELLRRKVNDCLQLKEVILPEIESESEVSLPELTDKHLYMVQRAFRGDPNEILVKKFNLNITRRDLSTLRDLNWLNDEVINFYMNMIIERAKDPKWPKSFAFNTFFYPKLIKDGPQSLRRWTKRVDIFKHDLVCVPIHLGMHWCMAIIDFRDKSIRYYDSMGSPNNRCLEALRAYLEAEHKDKKGSLYDTSNWILQNMDDIPQQMNGSDCGMFSCTFAEYLTRNAKITFTQEDMPYLRKKMVVEIMCGELLIK